MKTFLSFVLGKQNNSFCVDNGNHVFYISTNWMEHLCLWGKIKKKLIKVSSKIHFLVMSPFLIFSHLLSVVHSICTHPIGTREATATSFFCSVTASLFASFSFLTLVSSIITLDYQQSQSRLLVLALDMNRHFQWTIRTVKQMMWKMSPLCIMLFKCNGSREGTQRTI